MHFRRESGSLFSVVGEVPVLGHLLVLGEFADGGEEVVEFKGGAHLKLAAGVRAVDLDGVLLNVELGRDLLVEHVAGDEPDDELLALGERCKALALSLDVDSLAAVRDVPIMRLTLSRSFAGSTGFSQKSSAPRLRVETAMLMSPWPERKRIGRSIPLRVISS